jgi:hypothetical protein
MVCFQATFRPERDWHRFPRCEHGLLVLDS